MNKCLLRNCVHGSEIYLSKWSCADEVFYIKSSSSSSGIADLHNEIKGYEWYFRARNFGDGKPIKVTKVRADYLRLQIKAFPGEKLPLDASFITYKNIFERIIDHYNIIWGDSEDRPMHGDLSLDNVLVTPDDLFIIDWEHFQYCGAAWGFDLLYLFFETLWFNMRGFAGGKLENELAALSNLFRYLLNVTRISDKSFFTPLADTIAFIKSNREFWGPQLEFSDYKLPVLKYSDEEVLFIDRVLRSRLIND